MDIEVVLRAYMVCALWSSLDEDGEPLDDRFDVDDIDEETVEQMREDVESFVQAAQDETLLVDLNAEQVGHDFWLTRNHHGAGFWDRGLGEVGDRLTELAHPYGGVDLYVGDDGRVHA